MSIYDKASLVLIPSGTKTSKVYSQKPVNGDGDFTFSRSTAATRVNADGNIEKETQNLLLQSNSFDTTWLVNGVTITSGQAGYDGTNNAWLLQRNDGLARFLYQLTTTTGVATLSFYVKAGNTDWVYLNTINATAYFDLTNGVVGIVTGGDRIDSQIESVGNGWYRISITANDIDGIRIYPAVGNGVVSGASGVNILIQDAQLEQGLVARDVITTTTAAVEGGITDNVPRLDYTDSSCPALLLEPQRRNILPHSEYFGVYNALNGASIESNYSESPEGYNNATRVQLNAQSLSRIEYAAVVGSAVENKRFSVSCWVKSNGADTDFRLKCTHAGVLDYHSNDLVATSEWKRFTFTQLFGAGGGSTITAGVLNGTSNNSADLSIYGLQLEDDAAGGGSSYATSYIPTYGTSVTRAYENQDATGLNSSVFNNDNLTLFYDFDYNAEGREGSTTAYRIFSSSSQLGIKGTSNTARSLQIFSSGDFSGTINFNGAEATRIKLALRVTNGTCELFFNGAKDTETIDVSAAAPYTWGQITMLASNSINTSLNQCLGFPTALTDQELIDLTTI